jgi:hypothetical protein
MNTARRVLRPALALLAAALVASTAAACDSGSAAADDATYAPAAYGVQNGSVYDCYYADDVDEVTALVNAGLCPHGSVATAMPLYWEEEYYPYYSSPAYYGTYMPARYRTHYTSVTIVHFQSAHSADITRYSSTARYKSSSGGYVTGSSKVKFGSGSGSSAVHGGGSARTGGCAESMTVVQLRSGGSSGSGGSHGGGSARSGGGSGSSGSKSGSGSGSRGGC